MSPLEIKVLLHCYASPVPYDGPENVDFVAGLIKSFITNGLVEIDDMDVIITTKKGIFYVETLCSIPFPVIEYVIPRWFVKEKSL